MMDKFDALAQIRVYAEKKTGDLHGMIPYCRNLLDDGYCYDGMAVFHDDIHVRFYKRYPYGEIEMDEIVVHFKKGEAYRKIYKRYTLEQRFAMHRMIAEKEEAANQMKKRLEIEREEMINELRQKYADYFNSK
jgi:hypothetical protein